jgi:hypothetical protein
LAAIGLALGTSHALGQPSASANADQSTSAQDAPPEQAPPGQVVAARLNHANAGEAVCLNDGFLTTVARETQIPVKRQFAKVTLSDQAIFDHPFVFFTGAQAFELTDQARRRLKDYLDRGGFLLASASCSNYQWAKSFRALIAKLYPDRELKPLKADHPLRDTLYDIDRLDKKQPSPIEPLLGLTIGDRLGVVFSPVGVNDTDNAGGGCCCCGGNEIVNARALNANILVYALTH